MSKKPSDKQNGNKPTPRPQWWKPGQSGNPNGRPPSGHSLTEALRHELDEIAPKRVVEQVANLIYGADSSLDAAERKEKEQWKQTKVTWRDVFIKRSFFRVVTPQGDKVSEMILHQLDGRPMQRLADADGGKLFGDAPAEDLSRLSLDELREYRKLKAKALAAANGEGT